MSRSALGAAWSTLHEPRRVTAIYVACYVIAVLGGLAIITGSAQTVLPDGWDKLEGVILIIAGTVGAPAAWMGRWWAERAPVLLMVLTGLTLAILAIFVTLTPELPPVIDTTRSPSWALGIAFWLALFITRWALGVGRHPYAPGRGPATMATREAQAKRVMQHCERGDGLHENRG